MMKYILINIICAVFLIAQETISGIVKPVYEAKISFATDGIVNKINFKEGDTVYKNSVIMKLDDQLQMYETQRRKLVLEEKTQIKSLNENLKILKGILNKKERLYNETQSVSSNELDKLRMQYINTKAELQLLKNNEKKEKIEYKIASKLLEYYQLRSSVKAKIIKIEAEIGEWVQTGQKVVHLVNDDLCFVEIDLDINNFVNIKNSKKITVEVDINGKKILKKATLSLLSTVADSSSGFIRAKVNFSNIDNKVLPGLKAKVIYE